MISIIKGVLTEHELKYMDDDVLSLLDKLLNKYIADCLITYISNPDADQACVEKIRKTIGKTLEAIEKNKEIEALGIVDELWSISDYDVYDYIDDKTFYSKLQEIERLLPDCKMSLPARSQDTYRQFDAAIKSIILQHPNPEIPDMYKRYLANRSVLYSHGESAQYYISNTVYNYKSVWSGFKNGIDYVQYCDTKKLSPKERMMI